MTSFVLILLVFFPIIMGLVNYFVSQKCPKVREIIAIATSIIELVLMAYVVCVYPISNSFLGMNFKADGFRSIYAFIACFMWMCTSIFSEEYFAHYRNRNRYYL